jgi:hypothetical protein
MLSREYLVKSRHRFIGEVRSLFRSPNVYLWFLLIFLVITIANGMKFRLLSQATDSAGFLELVKKPFPNLTLENSALASHGLGLMNTVGYNVNEICSFIASYEPQNVSHWPYHPYLFSIVLGGIAKLPGLNPTMVSTSSIAFSYVLGFFILYLFLRRRNIGQLPILIWLSFLMISPPVFESLRGQLYFDRIFMGPGIGLVIGTMLLYSNLEDKIGKRLIHFSVLISVLISDRSSLSAAIILIVLPLSLAISKRNMLSSIPFLKRTLPYGFLAFCWYLIWTKFINKPFYSSQSNIVDLFSPKNLLNSWERLSGYQLSIFLIFIGTILFLILISITNARSVPLLVLALLPSLIIDVGGAQLSGYITHYHQLYLPILLSLATIGFVKVLQNVKISLNFRNFLTMNALGLSMILTIAFWISNPSYGGSVTTFAGKITQAYGFLSTDEEVMLSSESQLMPLNEMLSSHDILSISTLESLMPFIVETNSYTISYFPAGVGKADAVLLNYDQGASLPIVYPYGEPTPGVTIPVSKCVQAALDQNYRNIGEIERGSYKTLLYLRNDLK